MIVILDNTPSIQIVFYAHAELAENGSLYTYLHEKKKRPPPDQGLSWAGQIAEGM